MLEDAFSRKEGPEHRKTANRAAAVCRPNRIRSALSSSVIGFAVCVDSDRAKEKNRKTRGFPQEQPPRIPPRSGSRFDDVGNAK
jgi:hypothetical protein